VVLGWGGWRARACVSWGVRWEGVVGEAACVEGGGGGGRDGGEKCVLSGSVTATEGGLVRRGGLWMVSKCRSVGCRSKPRKTD